MWLSWRFGCVGDMVGLEVRLGFTFSLVGDWVGLGWIGLETGLDWTGVQIWFGGDLVELG